VLYEMGTGRRAFHGDSGISTLTSVLRDDIKPIGEVAPDVPPLLEVIIARCLNKDPDGRWQSMKEVGDALSSLRRTLDSGTFDRPVAATPASNPPTAKPPSAPPVPVTVPSTPATAAKTGTTEKQRPPAALILALVGLVVVGALAVGGWYLYNHPELWKKPTPIAQVNPAPTAAPATPEPQPPPAPAVETPAPAPQTTPAAGSEAKKPRNQKSLAPTGNKSTAAPPAPAPAPAENKNPPAKTNLPASPPPKKVAPPAPVPTVPVAVADSLPFSIMLDEDVPADAQGGQELHFTVVDGLQVDGSVVVAKGAKVTGAVVGEVGKKIMGIGSKKMNFQLLQTVAVDGQTLKVRATAGHGSSKGPAMRPFDTGKGSKSKELAAAKGTIYYGYTDGEKTVSVRK
ncbi:MAG TPA: hypothetical protein VEU96_04270, partial [Bryobacteraceae bacterium]|nr:hypothetical protein [Bryobacteraceae bacterium]